MSDDQTKRSKDAFNRATNPDGSPVRDTDNAAPQHKPNYAARPAPNLAPPGASGIKPRRNPLVPEQRKDQQSPERIQFQKKEPERIVFRKAENSLVPKRNDTGISIEGKRPAHSQWIDGKITSMPGYTFQAKMYDAPSKFGIEGGQISKLDVRKDGKTVMNFDRGWDQKPNSAEQREALQLIRNGLGDSQGKQIKAPERSPDKGNGMER